VKRELVRVRQRGITIELLERLGDRRMEETRPCLSEIRVNDLLQQRVREVVADAVDASGLLKNLLAEELVERGHDVRLGEARYPRQRIVGRARSDDGGEIGDGPCAGREPANASFDNVADGRRKMKRLHLPAGPARIRFGQRT
jgi:hypothetical protein